MAKNTELQKKTFTKWLNFHLGKTDVQVSDLFEDLRNGHVLLLLVEVFSGKRLAPESGTMRFHHTTNLNQALAHLRRDGVHIVNIDSSDIADGNETLTLGLVWALIRRYQVVSATGGAEGDAGESDSKAALLEWCRDRTRNYERVQINNFTTSWSNGLAFSALIHTHRPDLFVFDDLTNNSNEDNLRTAFMLAEEHFGVPQLLDPKDVNMPPVDEKTILVYVSQLQDALSSIMADPISPKTTVPSANSTADPFDDRSRVLQAETKNLLNWAQEQAEFYRKQKGALANLPPEELSMQQEALNTFLADDYKPKDGIRYQFKLEEGELIRCSKLKNVSPTAVEELNAVWNILKRQIEEYRSELTTRVKEIMRDRESQLKTVLAWINEKQRLYSQKSFPSDLQILGELLQQSENFCRTDKPQQEEAVKRIAKSLGPDFPLSSADSFGWPAVLESTFSELSNTHREYERNLREAVQSCEENISHLSMKLSEWAQSQRDHFEEEQKRLPNTCESLELLHDEFVDSYLAKERTTKIASKNALDKNLDVLVLRGSSIAKEQQVALATSFLQLNEAEENFRAALETALGHSIKQDLETDDRFSDVTSLMSWAEQRCKYWRDTASTLQKESIDSLKKLKREHLEEKCTSLRAKRKDMIAALSKLIEGGDEETQNMADQLETAYQSLQTATSDFAKALQTEIDQRKGDSLEVEAKGQADELLEWIEERTAFLQRRTFPVPNRSLFAKLCKDYEQFQDSEWAKRKAEKISALSVLENYPKHRILVSELRHVWTKLELEDEAYCLSLQNAFLQLQLLEDKHHQVQAKLRESADLLAWTEGKIEHFQEKSFPNSRLELELLDEKVAVFEMKEKVEFADRKLALEAALAQTKPAGSSDRWDDSLSMSLSPGMFYRLQVSVSTLHLAWERMEREKTTYVAALAEVLEKDKPQQAVNRQIEVPEDVDFPRDSYDKLPNGTFCDLIARVWFSHEHSVVPF